LPATPAEQDTLEARIGRLLSRTKGQLHQAVRALVWRLAVHPRQQVGRLVYTELAVGYVAKAAGVGRETARQAWHMVRAALGWASVPLHQVRALGAAVRRLVPGGRWGQHLLLPAPCAAACGAVAARLGLGPEHRAAPDGPEWRVLGLVHRRGRHRLAVCPWHEDQDPSLLLNDNGDGSGSGVCLGCADEQGQRLRVYWREHGGVLYARLARRIVPQAPAQPRSGTIHNPRVLPAGPGRHLLVRVRGGCARRAPSACSDLLGVLRTADRRSQRDSAWGEAAHACAVGDGPGQAYASVEAQVPVAWRTQRTRRGEVQVPDRWEPTAVQWVLADLDGFTDVPLDDAGLRLAGQALARWAQGQALLSGRLAIVRTSHLGVQVVMELAEARGDPRAWYRTGEARALCCALDAAALHAVRAVGFVGGHADQAVHAAGRLMRRPGWRLDRDGVLWRSRLAWYNRAGGA
jgi:hypothetical protein